LVRVARDAVGRMETKPPEILIDRLRRDEITPAEAKQEAERSDAPEKRCKLMEAWAAYSEPKATSNVLQLRKR
jgi:hypothetical protein